MTFQPIPNSSSSLRVVRRKRNLFPTSSSEQSGLDIIKSMQESQYLLKKKSNKFSENVQPQQAIKVDVQLLGTGTNQNKIDYDDVNRNRDSKTQSEELYIQQLSKIVEQNSAEAEQKFLRIVREHIYFNDLIPYALSHMGAHLLTNGAFHFLWLSVIQHFHHDCFSELKKYYYGIFITGIQRNLQLYEESFYFSMEKLSFDCQSTLVFDGEGDDDIVPDQSTLNQRSPIDIFQSQLPQKQDDNSKRQTGKSSSLIEDSISEQNQPISINQKLLQIRQSNQLRRSAQLACTFFGIGPENTFYIDEIEVEEILEEAADTKSEYAIFLARKKMPSIYQTQQAKIYFTCTKFQSIESFIRIQLTYGKIYGFIMINNFNFNSAKQISPRTLRKNPKESRLL